MIAGTITIVLAATLAQAAAAQPDAVAHSKTILAAAAAGEFERVEAQFTPDMKVALPPGRLAAMWAGLEMRAGAFKACEASPRVVDIGDKRMVITRCEFHNGAFDIQFAFDAAARISGLVFRPVAAAPSAAPLPPYARAGSYTESPIAIGSGPLALPGTLTLPAGDATIPAVVLVHGSGPQDRDSTVGPNKPFRDLAAGLARVCRQLPGERHEIGPPDRLGVVLGPAGARQEERVRPARHGHDAAACRCQHALGG